MFSHNAFTKTFTALCLLQVLSSCLVTISDNEYGTGTGNTVEPTIKAPIFAYPEGRVDLNTQITITTDIEGASIYYTTGSGEPDTLYTDPITIDKTTVIRAIAMKDKDTFSEEVSVKYLILKTSDPVINPSGGEVVVGTQISITTDTPEADTYYTTDGTDPTSDSLLYTGDIEITESATIKAIAIKKGYTDSDVATSLYSIPGSVSAPRFNPVSKKLAKDSTVQITSYTKGASIYYTTDGSAPDQASSILYSSPIFINEAVTIRAKAYKQGYPSSPVSTVTYTISQ